MDEELRELIERNQRNMKELASDMREASRIVADEKTPTIVQIKKVARVPSGTRKPTGKKENEALRDIETNKR